MASGYEGSGCAWVAAVFVNGRKGLLVTACSALLDQIGKNKDGGAGGGIEGHDDGIELPQLLRLPRPLQRCPRRRRRRSSSRSPACPAAPVVVGGVLGADKEGALLRSLGCERAGGGSARLSIVPPFGTGSSNGAASCSKAAMHSIAYLGNVVNEDILLA